MSPKLLPLIVSPVVCALIGWFTNWVAVKMLFYPRQPWSCWLFTIQGVFPKRQKALAERMAKVVEEELICGQDIGAMLRDPSMTAVLHQAVEGTVDRLLTESLPKAVPMAAMFLSGDILKRVKGLLVPEIEKFIPEMVDNAASKVESCIDVRRHVRERIEGFSMDKLEAMLIGIMEKEFRFIEVIGGVLGLAIGVLQSLFFYVA